MLAYEHRRNKRRRERLDTHAAALREQKLLTAEAATALVTAALD